jgi:hypothetical protein
MSNVTINFENGVYEGSDPYNLSTFISGEYNGELIFYVNGGLESGVSAKSSFWAENIDDLVKKIDSGKKTA